MRKLAAVLVPCALLVACAGAPPEPAPAPPSATTTAPTATPAPEITSPGPDVVADGDGTLLTAVRVAEQDGFDRIVFEFATARPRHQIDYVDLPVTSDPAGEEVPLAGSAALQMSLIGSSAYRELGDPEQAFPIPRRIGADLPEVAELVNLGDWEGVIVWAAGVRERTAFTVSELDGPPRLVIDVAHAP